MDALVEQEHGEAGFVVVERTPPTRRTGRTGLLVGLAVLLALALGVLVRQALLVPAAGTAGVPLGAVAGTRDDGLVPPGTTALTPTAPTVLFDIPAPPGVVRAARLRTPATAVLLAVSVADPTRAGAVTVSGADPSPTPQLRVAGPGATTSGLAMVRLGAERIVRARSSAGGRVAVTLVGEYRPVGGPSDAGRTVATAPRRIAHRVTARVGPDGVVTAGLPGAAAVLVRATADVGRAGGVLTLGGVTLRWSPAAGTDPIRSGLALVRLDHGRFPVSYHGGKALDLDVVGFVTAPGDARSAAGLFVPGATADRRAGGTMLLVTGPATVGRTVVRAGRTQLLPAVPGTAVPARAEVLGIYLKG